MSELFVYRLRIACGLALVVLAGVLLIFWKADYKAVPLSALGGLGAVLILQKSRNPSELIKGQGKFSSATVRSINIAILALMGVFLVVGMVALLTK